MTDEQLLRMSQLQKTLNQHGDGSLTPKEQAELEGLQTQLRDEISEQANGGKATASASTAKNTGTAGLTFHRYTLGNRY